MIEIDIAPVELNDLTEIPISKELERMQSGNTNLRDILSTPEQFNSERWMIKRCTGIRKALEKKRSMLNTKACIKSTGEENENEE